MFTIEETKAMLNKYETAINELESYIETNASVLSEREIKNMNRTIYRLKNNRAAVKSRLNMLKYISE